MILWNFFNFGTISGFKATRCKKNIRKSFEELVRAFLLERFTNVFFAAFCVETRNPAKIEKISKYHNFFVSGWIVLGPRVRLLKIIKFCDFWKICARAHARAGAHENLKNRFWSKMSQFQNDFLERVGWRAPTFFDFQIVYDKNITN